MAHFDRGIPPDNRHPLTGVPLNPIPIQRVRLKFDHAVTAWILRQQGVKYNVIAQLLGVNPHRLGEVFRQELHRGSANEALRRLMQN